MARPSPDGEQLLETPIPATRRHVLLSGIAVFGALAAPLGSLAQSVGKVWRIGALSARSRLKQGPTHIDFFRNLSGLGYIEGRNLIVQWKFADDDLKRLAN